MKILIIVPSLRGGGAERVVSLLSQEWAKNNDVRIGLFNCNDRIYDYGGMLINLGERQDKYRFGKLGLLVGRILALKAVIGKQAPEKIFTFMESANIPTILASLICKCTDKLTISVHNNPSFFIMYQKFFILTLYRFANEIVAVSSGISRALKKHYFLPKTKVRCIHNPVDHSYIFKKMNEKSDFVVPINKKIFFLGVGSLEKQKGFDLLLKAYINLKERGTNSGMIILGEGSERKKLEKFIRDNDLSEDVYMPGYVENPFIFFSKAIGFVLSSRYEGMGNVIMEAMACGCPVISFNCPYGPEDIIKNEENGLLVKNGDIKALSLAMERIEGDGGLRKKLVREGEKTSRLFDVKNITKKWLVNC